MLGCMHVKTKQNRPGSAKCLTAEMVSPPAFVFAQPFFSVHGRMEMMFCSENHWGSRVKDEGTLGPPGGDMYADGKAIP